MSGVAVGIDFGTTDSYVGIWENDDKVSGDLKGRASIIAAGDSSSGSKSIPSVVAFKENAHENADSKVTVGYPAIASQHRNASNTIVCIKRIIGRAFVDPVTSEFARSRGIYFEIVDRSEDAAVEVHFQGRKQSFSPEEILTRLLEKMKEVVLERFDGSPSHSGSSQESPIRKVVIAVPQALNIRQRNVIRKAGEACGFGDVELLSEPIAAAIALRAQSAEGDIKLTGENLAVVDLGSATFDVTILETNAREFVVKSHASDTWLGGEDFDQRLVDHFVARFRSDNECNSEPTARDIVRLKHACREGKEGLISQESIDIEIGSFCEGKDLSYAVERIEFEELCSDLFKRLTPPLEDALKRAELDKTQIDTVLMVGGSCMMTKVKEIVGSFFPGTDVVHNASMSEAVAEGATTFAWSLLEHGEARPSNDRSIQRGNSVILSTRRDGNSGARIAAHSLGMQTFGDVMTVLIEKNTRLPHRGSVYLGWMSGATPTIKIAVLQGEEPQASQNRQLARFNASAPGNGRNVRITVEFHLDEQGRLDVRVVSTGEGGAQTSAYSIDGVETASLAAMANTGGDQVESEAKGLAGGPSTSDGNFSERLSGNAEGMEDQIIAIRKRRKSPPMVIENWIRSLDLRTHRSFHQQKQKKIDEGLEIVSALKTRYDSPASRRGQNVAEEFRRMRVYLNVLELASTLLRALCNVPKQDTQLLRKPSYSSAEALYIREFDTPLLGVLNPCYVALDVLDKPFTDYIGSPTGGSVLDSSILALETSLQKLNRFWGTNPSDPIRKAHAVLARSRLE